MAIEQDLSVRTRAVPRRGFVCEGPSMTKQAMKEECDVNVIMKKYEKSGLVAHVNERQGNYLDLSEGFDFRTSLERSRKATEVFMTLPAALRQHFYNDVAYFLDFVSNPANEAAMIDLGLKKPPEKPVAQPAPSPVANPALVV